MQNYVNIPLDLWQPCFLVSHLFHLPHIQQSGLRYPPPAQKEIFTKTQTYGRYILSPKTKAYLHILHHNTSSYPKLVIVHFLYLFLHCRSPTRHNYSKYGRHNVDIFLLLQFVFWRKYPTKSPSIPILEIFPSCSFPNSCKLLSLQSWHFHLDLTAYKTLMNIYLSATFDMNLNLH